MLPQRGDRQRLAQRGLLELHAPVDQIRHPLGRELALGQGREHLAAADARQVADQRGDLDVGGLEHLLHAVDHPAAVAQELRALAGQVPQLPLGLGRHERRAEQPVLQQLRDPLAVGHVGLAAGDAADVLGVDQHQLQAILQQVPHRLPVDAGRFHRGDRHAQSAQPVPQAQDLSAGRAERLDRRFPPVQADANHQRVLVHVDPRTAGVNTIHSTPP